VGKCLAGARFVFSAVLAAIIVCGFTFRSSAPVRTNGSSAETAPLNIVFAARDREPANARQQLYLAQENGSTFTRISPNDGRYYDWPVFAMNGSRILFTARADVPNGVFAPGQEDLYLADLSGANITPLTHTSWRNEQPKISPDGRSMIFSSLWPEYANIAIYGMDLATSQVHNLTARTLPFFGADADPRWSPDGSLIAFAGSYASGFIPTQIFVMNPDGSHRRNISNDAFLNTDPAISPDGRFVAYSSYRGPVRVDPNGNNDRFSLPLSDWHLVVSDLRSGEQRVLTQGLECAYRDASRACAPDESPAWVPQWSPDGKRIGYLGFTSQGEQGLFSIGVDGQSPQVVLSLPNKVVTYWDWALPGAAPAGAIERIGGAVPKDRLLTGGQRFTELRPGAALGPVQLGTAETDLWTDSTLLSMPPDLQLTLARWTPDRKRILFSARKSFDPSAPQPGPAPPRGQERQVHFTFNDLALQLFASTRPSQDAAEQIFIMQGNGSVQQLTSPWTEDYMDALHPEDARGNADPDVSRDGRYVVFTNFSTLTAESFILRLDLQTGEVINLTNATSGAMPVADSHPRYSPDGSHIVFASATGASSQLFMMDSDGHNVRPLTDADFYDTEPAWSPNGQEIVYTSYRGSTPLEVGEEMDTNAGKPLTLPLHDWFLIKLDLRTGQEWQLTRDAGAFAHRAVWSPDGTHIAYVSFDPGSKLGQSDIYVMDADGRHAQPMQITIRTSEEFVDWR
jgi:Tol biopolymer transport system component